MSGVPRCDGYDGCKKAVCGSKCYHAIELMDRATFRERNGAVLVPDLIEGRQKPSSWIKKIPREYALFYATFSRCR